MSRKIVWISDLHIPFHDIKNINKIFKNHASPDTILILGGDLMDCHALSDFPKSKHIPLEHEYRILSDLVYRASKLFKEVHIISGNHEDRWVRNVVNRVNLAARFLIGKHMLTRIANGDVYTDDERWLEGKRRMPNVYCPSDKHGPLWYIQIGKTIFAHPSGRVSSGTNSLAAKAVKYFSERNFNFDSVVVGHSHRASIDYGYRLMIESGSLCSPLDYASSSKMSYGPGVTSFVIIYQDKKGNTSRRRSRLICLN